MRSELRRNGTAGFAWTNHTAFWNRAWHHNLVKWYINRNNPVIYSTWKEVGVIDGQAVENHSMPVVGYKREFYRGICWRRVMPERKWILVDSTWSSRRGSVWKNKYKKWINPHGNSRGYIRFDARTNYWTIGAMTYVRSW